MSRSARGPIGLRIEHPRIPDGVMGTEVLAHSPCIMLPVEDGVPSEVAVTIPLSMSGFSAR